MSAAPQQHEATISIDDDVAVLTEQIDALKRLAEQDTVSAEQIYDISIRWGTALAGRLPRLVYYSSLGALADTDQRRFGELCDELSALTPLVTKWGLARPVLPETPTASAG
ncbi:hypothetical protein [Mycobacterium talmoniae]|uniref:Uncharacterized protein n=1 Tax=Mycobacterium talmoniae TaxID=1858794 RepID=A0A1S1NND2_9MYCO|nr:MULTISPECIES: hypothetical protein [Mycobacterium]OHV04266.1 hypothetical protein BKN37_10810 [Mycobacterium talmoniae]PQM46852.1 hypothetical protein C1Y40_02967 [Mycobacterium talmoniae]TDH49421.1 hypothetical protein E2F47_20810 [Mycobacterium eburneum]